MTIAELPHVLVVGEDADITASMCQSLASGPFRCTGAIGSHEAFAVTKHSGVDVALVDVSGLRSQDGLDLARRLRDETEDLGVVLVAASRSLEDLVDALRAGVVDYLSKPVAGSELADAVRRAVEWRSAAQMSRGAVGRYEQEMALGARRFADILAEAGIASTVALRVYLEQLYLKNAPAFRHAERVASAAVLIATNMNVSESEIGHIERAALLHDVGKLVIPKPIMRKAWPLSVAEQAIIRSHVRVAAEAAAGVPFLAPAAPMLAASARALRRHRLSARAPRVGDSSRRASHCRGRGVRHAARRADPARTRTDDRGGERRTGARRRHALRSRRRQGLAPLSRSIRAANSDGTAFMTRWRGPAPL